MHREDLIMFPRSFLALLLFTFFLCTGCVGLSNQDFTPSYTVSDEGLLSLSLSDASVSSTLMESRGNVSVEELTFVTFAGNVSAVLITPVQPVASLVWAPGAGVPATGHIDHLIPYAEKGFAVLVVDIRGNGGKTSGYPLNIEQDYAKYSSREWPQVYLIIADLIEAERYLHHRYGSSVPVWMVGESNGGRYAAISSVIDPDVTGFVGISTSGYGLAGNQYQGDGRKFLLSIDPDFAGPSLNPRPALIFHAPQDSIIPEESGKELVKIIGPSAQFFEFNGTHGVNSEVDATLLMLLQNRSSA